MAGIVFWACLWLAAVLKSTLATLRFQAQWHDDDYAWTNNSLELQHSCGSSPAIPCTGLALPASLAQTGVLNGSQICNSFTWIMVFVVFVLRAPVVAKLPVYLFLWGGMGEVWIIVVNRSDRTSKQMICTLVVAVGSFLCVGNKQRWKCGAWPRDG